MVDEVNSIFGLDGNDSSGETAAAASCLSISPRHLPPDLYVP